MEYLGFCFPYNPGELAIIPNSGYLSVGKCKKHTDRSVLTSGLISFFKLSAEYSFFSWKNKTRFGILHYSKMKQEHLNHLYDATENILTQKDKYKQKIMCRN